jgi:hypothetical protein
MVAGLPIPLPEGWISEWDEESKQWYFGETEYFSERMGFKRVN